jgi:hypothetical protein
MEREVKKRTSATSASLLGRNNSPTYEDDHSLPHTPNSSARALLELGKFWRGGGEGEGGEQAKPSILFVAGEYGDDDDDDDDGGGDDDDDSSELSDTDSDDVLQSEDEDEAQADEDGDGDGDGDGSEGEDSDDDMCDGVSVSVATSTSVSVNRSEAGVTDQSGRSGG